MRIDEAQCIGPVQVEVVANGVATPRFGIAHLALWTLCTSAFLVTEELPVVRRTDAFAFAIATFRAITAGALFSGFIVLVNAHLRQCRSTAWHPGHWILALNAPCLAALVLLNKWIQWTSDVVPIPVIGLPTVITAIAYAFASWRTAERLWKTVFTGIACSLAFEAADWFGLSYDLNGGASSLLAGVIWSGVVLAAAWDLRTRRQRDWLHWWGLAVFLSSPVGSTIFRIAWSVAH